MTVRDAVKGTTSGLFLVYRERECLQEAAEHRRRKVQLAQAQQGLTSAGEPPHTPSIGSPAHGSADIPWWPGERVIGGGPWSRLPRWRADLDSPLPSSNPTAARTDGKQAPCGRKVHGQQKPSQQVKAQLWDLRRPQSAPSLLEGNDLPAQPPEKSSQADSHAGHAHKQNNKEGQSHRAQHSDQHQKVQPARHARRAAQQRRSLAGRVAEREAEKIVYVQRPSAQQQLRPAGSVPNFRELHAKWDAHLAAAKAAMHKRLTTPQVSNLSSVCKGDMMSGISAGGFSAARMASWVNCSTA